ncbi:DUF2681 domain-containing protein [Rodentibacter pneumotropicus]|uniref:DUF2681 domain-containing protein n=1 Tax=Rodentibacter pneumotropicus TaxID=758 RepID=UPI00109C185B|nr:DUF2681 domain-containing protein [Rodentibacter pneumotropicus]NBH76202.1 DUF2681 domain-containing protein [Rodentibacter pneumotropicus]THA08340.1 DUF2681 domain-containing protein [Rodentibacter pneumotropicus]THA12562.1 DUF2681 domain-containing protein [Rodentibacter pneumotropicus]
MNLQFIVLAVIGAVLLTGYIWHKFSRASREIDRLLKTNAALEQEKAVSETKVKHYETRKNHEENSRHADRTSLIDSLQKSGDLRD